MKYIFPALVAFVVLVLSVSMLQHFAIQRTLELRNRPETKWHRYIISKWNRDEVVLYTVTVRGYTHTKDTHLGTVSFANETFKASWAEILRSHQDNEQYKSFLMLGSAEWIEPKPGMTILEFDNPNFPKGRNWEIIGF